MTGYESATHITGTARADRMTNTTPYTPDCSHGMNSARIGVVEAERLYKSNRLRELIGVGPEAQPLEVKAACKRALLLHHPDKGGCAEVFKLVQPATETLLLEENLYAFEGGVPSWAKLQLKELADLRRDVAIWRNRLESATSKLEANLSASAWPRVHNDSLAAKKAVWNLNVILQQALARFQSCYLEHVRVIRARAEESEARRAKEAAELAILKRNYRGVVTTMRQRPHREGKRFPVMPRAVVDLKARAALGVLRVAYRKAAKITHQRLQRGGIDEDVEPKTVELLAKAYALVDLSCDQAHCHMTIYRARFPVLPASDPRACELVELCREQRRLTKCLKWGMPADQYQDLCMRIEQLRDQAVILLESRVR
jgi:hypothetical protein